MELYLIMSRVGVGGRKWGWRGMLAPDYGQLVRWAKEFEFFFYRQGGNS